jgi:hypothetical protein
MAILNIFHGVVGNGIFKASNWRFMGFTMG